MTVVESLGSLKGLSNKLWSLNLGLVAELAGFQKCLLLNRDHKYVPNVDTLKTNIMLN